MSGAVAWIFVDPRATPVIVTLAPTALAGIVMDGGTVTTLLLSEVRVTITGATAAAGRFTITLCVPPAITVMVCDEKLSRAVTDTEVVVEP
jgi:hypothetical protein